MYREPTEASKCNAIKDPSAHARSTIRRQASVRGHPSTRHHRLMHGTRPPYRSPLPRAIVDGVEREVSGLSRRVRSPLSQSDSRDVPYDLPRALADSRRREVGERAIAHMMNHANPGRLMRIRRDPSFHDSHNHPPPDEGPPNQRNPDSLPFTSRFAPAAAFHSAIHHPDGVRLPSFSQLDASRDDPGSHVPLLRRVGHRSVNEAHRLNREPAVDGLGDRQRSLTPDDDHENDAWETLLTTITPDDNLPSADSSFNSASAAATNASRDGTSANPSNSETAPSLGSAPPTMHMVLEPYPEYLNPCDYAASSDSETEPEQESNHRPLDRINRSRLRPLPRHSHQYSTINGHPPIPAASVAFTDSPTIRNGRHSPLARILDQLVDREDGTNSILGPIPDFMFAAAGLPPPVGRRTGDNNGPPDTDGADGPVRQRIY